MSSVALDRILLSLAMETPHVLNHLRLLVVHCKSTHIVFLYQVYYYLLTTLSFAHGILRSALRARAWSAGTATLKPPC